ncbi:hypothetical protein AVEN_77366-1 [Araneus ventricosus]|uniref:Uncharacterized protein n=1 Tax=Araneus ventricosus TaxID=182803 RepID=A0A4Y2C892_ARAVE|nr:hypothetical protein AVEN_77366-1 [Araneus ventricosus]
MLDCSTPLNASDAGSVTASEVQRLQRVRYRAEVLEPYAMLFQAAFGEILFVERLRGVLLNFWRYRYSPNGEARKIIASQLNGTCLGCSRKILFKISSLSQGLQNWERRKLS